MVNKLSATIMTITPGILDLMMKSNLKLEEASKILYNSKMYADLEDEKTGLWKLSSEELYDILSKEM